MGNTQWSGYLSFKATNPEIDSEIKSAMVPVKKFLVKGGIQRAIELSGKDDASVALEIHDVKKFGNISLFLPRTRGFEWHQLWEIAEHNLPVSFSFFTTGSVGKTLTHQFNVISLNAKITDQPIKFSDWDSRDVLRVNFSLPNVRIVHGARDGGDFVEEDL